MSHRAYRGIVLIQLLLGLLACSNATQDFAPVIEEPIPVDNPGANGLVLDASYKSIALQWNNPILEPIQFVKIFRKTGDNLFSTSGNGIPDSAYLLKTIDYTSGNVPISDAYVDNNNLIDNVLYYYAVYALYSTTKYSAAAIQSITTPDILSVVSTDPPADTPTSNYANSAIGHVELLFSDNLQKQAYLLKPTDLVLISQSNMIVEALSVNYDDFVQNKISFGVPTFNLHTTYQAKFNADIRGAIGAPLKNNHEFSWTFTTADGVWSTQKPLDSIAAVDRDDIQAQVDANGNVLLIWRETPTTLVSRYGNIDKVWSASVGTTRVVTGSNIIGKVKLAMNRNGNAIAAWTESDPTSVLNTNLFVRKFSPGSGWDINGMRRINDGTSTTNSSSVDVDEFDLGINNSGDVMVVWHAAALNNNYFNFDSNIVNGSNVIFTGTYFLDGGAPDSINLVVLERFDNIFTGAAYGNISFPNSNEVWLNYSAFSNQSDLTSLYLTATASLQSQVGTQPAIVSNANEIVWMAWVEPSSNATTTSYNIKVGKFDVTNNALGASTLLATMNEKPTTPIAMAESDTRNDVIVAWADSAAAYISYFDGLSQQWTANSVSNMPFAYKFSDQTGITSIDAVLDNANNAHIVWRGVGNIYSLRLSHLKSFDTWLSGALPTPINLVSVGSSAFS